MSDQLIPNIERSVRAEILQVFSDVNDARSQVGTKNSRKYIKVTTDGDRLKIEAVTRGEKSRMSDVVSIIQRLNASALMGGAVERLNPVKEFLLTEERKIDPNVKDFDRALDSDVVERTKVAVLEMEKFITDSFRIGEVEADLKKKITNIVANGIVEDFAKDYGRIASFKRKDEEKNLCDLDRQPRMFCEGEPTDAERNTKRIKTAKAAIDEMLVTEQDRSSLWGPVMQVAVSQMSGNALGVPLIAPLKNNFSELRSLREFIPVVNQFPIELEIIRKDGDINQVKVRTKIIVDVGEDLGGGKKKVVADEVLTAKLSYTILLDESGQPKIDKLITEYIVRKPKGLREKFSLLIDKIKNWFKSFLGDYRNRFDIIKKSLIDIEAVDTRIKEINAQVENEAIAKREMKSEKVELSVITPPSSSTLDARSSSDGSIGNEDSSLSSPGGPIESVVTADVTKGGLQQEKEIAKLIEKREKNAVFFAEEETS